MSARSAIVWVSRTEQAVVAAVRFEASRSGGNSTLTTARGGRGARRPRPSSTVPARVSWWAW